MFGILKGLLGEEPLPLHLDVEGGGDVRHQDVDQLAHAEHNVLEDDHEGELEVRNIFYFYLHAMIAQSNCMFVIKYIAHSTQIILNIPELYTLACTNFF